jgi:adenine-specific DNA-methyltransferase
MKYMGSKRWMLDNGLGQLLLEQSKGANRIVDLFCGAGSVAWFAAQKTDLPVLATDLQQYAVVLARAVLSRRRPLNPGNIESLWLERARRLRSTSVLWKKSLRLEQKRVTKKEVEKARRLCRKLSSVGPTWSAYGGHYFSPSQALTIDYMIKCLPGKEPEKSVCLAAAVSAASKCIASPGHTAQPFRATGGGIKYLREAWSRDPISMAKKALEDICPRYARTLGDTRVSDAMKVTSRLKPTDLVIIDPPYSSVQYSRFYHVLETIARGKCKAVTGVGRYPPIQERPQSEFSNKGQSRTALERLFRALAKAGATAIITFPAGEASNGLSGRIVINTACKWFDVEKQVVKGRFSTLGGDNHHRKARKASRELILLLQPHKAS